MYRISKIPSVLTTKRMINQIGCFNLADFQQARAFQTKDQIRIIVNTIGEILNCEARDVKPKSIINLIDLSI